MWLFNIFEWNNLFQKTGKWISESRLCCKVPASRASRRFRFFCSDISWWSNYKTITLLGRASMSPPHSRIHTAVRACYVPPPLARSLLGIQINVTPSLTSQPTRFLSLPHFWPRIPVSNSDPGFRWRKHVPTCLSLPTPRSTYLIILPRATPLLLLCPQPIGCFPI